MNNLQHIPEKEFGPVLVTLNPLVKPRDEVTYGSWEYSHPQFTTKVTLPPPALRFSPFIPYHLVSSHRSPPSNLF